MDKYVYHDGLRFVRDEKSGYYLNSKTGKRLHRYVWESRFGPIPTDFHIHHKDGNRSNNDISNLDLVRSSEHEGTHSRNRVKSNPEWLKRFNENGRESAKEWHRSAAGKEWHKQHYEKMKDKLHQKETYVCDYCGQAFETNKKNSNRFCGIKCKAAWRRKAGLDNEIRKCPNCGKQFTTNKYSKQSCCSTACSNTYRTKLKNQIN